MTTKATDTHSPTPAAEPLALRLSEELGPTRETVVRLARAAGVNGDPAGPGDDGIDTWYGNQYLPSGALTKLVALTMAAERERFQRLIARHCEDACVAAVLEDSVRLGLDVAA